jgi:hypothetical protein
VYWQSATNTRLMNDFMLQSRHIWSLISGTDANLDEHQIHKNTSTVRELFKSLSSFEVNIHDLVLG